MRAGLFPVEWFTCIEKFVNAVRGIWLTTKTATALIIGGLICVLLRRSKTL